MTQLTFQHAVQHHQAGRLADAEKLYRQVLAQQPNHADALHRLGGVLAALNRNDEAADSIRRALTLRPNWPEASSNLGNVLRNLGRLDEAVAACRQALALKPDYAIAHNNLANALKDQGHRDEAITAYRRAVALNPNYAKALGNLGLALYGAGQLDEAIAAYRRAIALQPDNPDHHNNLGNALGDTGHLDEAIAAYRQAVALQPNRPDTLGTLGNACYDKGQLEEAIAAYRQAIALKPNNPEAYSNLGISLQRQGCPDEALAAFRQALSLNPEFPKAHSNIGNALSDQGRLDEAAAAYRQALALKPDYASAHSNLVLGLHYHPGYDAPALARELRTWNLQHAAPLQKFITPHANTRDPARRLRIGYVSPDLRNHVVGRFLLPLLAHHDKTQFEIFAYAQVAVPDAMTHRLQAHIDTYRTTVGLSDLQAADLIRRDQIDILVDLAMHTAGNRLLIFALKPAPVQVTYLAYCASTGMDTIDYRLSDPYLDPPGMDESIYSEKTVRLPETYWCYEPCVAPLDVGPLPALAQGRITFGCLNNFCKVTEPTLAAWAQILRSVPTSHLLLHAHPGTHRQNVLGRLARANIDPARIAFAGKVPAPDYFRLYQQIDIALDTFPFGGGTTTCDALYMGVPVISLLGQTAVGRGGLSILSNLGAPELVAHSPDQYIHLATTLANDLPRLTELRATLRRRMEQSPLMDAPRFARHVEAAYRQMWKIWCG